VKGRPDKAGDFRYPLSECQPVVTGPDGLLQARGVALRP
jgi:hypothetical protein